MRSSPVISLRSAQRPVSSRPSSHSEMAAAGRLAGWCASASTTSRGSRRAGRIVMAGRASAAPRGPGHIRADRLGQIAHVIARHRNSMGRALGHQAADQIRLGWRNESAAGQCRQRPAALRVGTCARSNPPSAASWRCGGARSRAGREAGRSVHAGASRPGRRLLRLVDLRPHFLVAVAEHVQRARLDAARTAPMHERVLLAVRHPHLLRPSVEDGAAQFVQSQWSEMTSGSSTPCWRARARTRIQPDA